jgi:hypothetical protein
MIDQSSQPAAGVNRAPLRYRLEVIAPTVADVVLSAGGWLFDRAIAGWDVNVHLAEDADTRALQILGVKSSALEAGFESSERFDATPALAVAVEMFIGDTALHSAVHAALGRRYVEITLWGAKCPPELHRRLDTMQHHLSAAARLYKAHALMAADIPHNGCDPTEEFRSGARLLPHDHADLTPLGDSGRQNFVRAMRQSQ